MTSLASAFADWSVSVAALAVAKPDERLRVIQLNESATVLAMAEWNRNPGVMVKPNRMWMK